MKRWTLKAQLLAFSLGGLLALAVTFWFGQKIMADARHQQLVATAIQDQRLLWKAMRYHYRSQLEEETRALTRSRDAVKALKKGDRAALEEAALPTFRRLQAAGKMDDLLIAGRDGNVMLHAGKGPASATQQAFLKRVVNERKLLDELATAGDGTPVLMLGFPLYSRGKPAGAAAYVVKLERLAGDLAEEGLFSTLLLSPDRRLVFSSEDESNLNLDTLPRLDEPAFREMEEGDSVWATTLLPLRDSAGRPVATLAAQQEVTEMARAIQRAGWLELLLGLGVLALMAALISWQMNRAFAPLKKAMQAVDDIARGDLSQNIRCQSYSEIATMLQGIEGMREQLRHIVESLLGYTGALQREASEASRIAAETSEGASRQLTETQSVATAMNQMSATVMEVANSATAAAQAADRANERTTEGLSTTGEVRQSIETLAQKVSSGAEAIRRVEQESDAIGQILDVIRGIAEQTNLLALNAAIEAARAGEQGRGFAVVADEVRTLASRTQESTSEIQAMIERLQNGTQQAVGIMEEGREQAEQSVDRAQLAAQALESIAEAVREISQMNTQIATAAEQQSTVAEEINRSVHRISEVAEISTEGARQAADSNRRIAELADQLQALTARFRL